VASFVISIYVFLKNAWISDDAYIVFRSIEQLFAGNGPTWNPHERVQAFTSPFWFWLLSFVRLFSSNVYLNAIVVSFVLWLLTVWVLRKLFTDDAVLFAGVLLLTASTGFFDFTSSGLENVLAYFFISLYLLYYVRLFPFGDDESSLCPEAERRTLKFVWLIFGLTVFVREDLALLLLPSIIYLTWIKRHFLSKRQWSLLVFASLLPVIAWSLFSLLYYGFPFPNTAYAKLNTGIAYIALIRQGIYYYIASLQWDTVTLIVIGTALFLMLARTENKSLKYIGYGILLNLLYIGYIGGDFMLGRFFSYAYLIAVSILLLIAAREFSFSTKSVGVILIVLYLIMSPHTPMNSPVYYYNTSIHYGVADERGYYFRQLSLYRYFRLCGRVKVFPEHPWSAAGLKFRASADSVRIYKNIGIYGYFAGTAKTIIDPFALADPLLARLPVTDSWRVGHYRRNIPAGYIDSVKNNKPLIEDKQLNEFYAKLRIITHGPDLLDRKRIRTILMFNLGAYNYLLQDER